MNLYTVNNIPNVNNLTEILSLNKELADINYALDESSIIAITNQKGTIISVNKKFCELSKYNEDELIGSDHRILNSGHHSKEFFRDMWRTIGSGTVWRGEILNKAKDGSFYWVHTTIVPILNEKKKPSRYISFRIDITEQKRIETELRNSLRREFNLTVKNLENGIFKMKKDQILYQSLLQHSQDAVFSLDQDGNIQNSNPATEKLLGYTKNKLQKMTLHGLTVDKYQAMNQTSFAKAMQGEPQNFDTAILHRNGQKIHLNLTYLPISTEQQISGLYVIGKDISEQKRAQEINAFLATHDELTKLLNRRGFEESLKSSLVSARENNHMLAVMYLDLDRFKNINDTLGHFIGDRLLEQLADRLVQHVGERNFIARMGGDEFMILCPKIKSDADLIPIAEELLTCLKEPFFIEEYELLVTASIGISIFPTDGDTVVDMMKRSDVALYRAKDLGRNNYQIYTKIMDRSSYQTFLLERDLRKAIRNNEFIVHLQPRIDANTRKILGAEALIRWNHPKLGLLSPGNFIPLAEETGLIIQLGTWMKKRVCELLVEWRETGVPLVPISINISAQRFLQKDFTQSVRKFIEQYGIEGSLIELEITENSLMKNVGDVIQTIHDLKELGIKIYIDDFGTGYSSFSYLKTYKLDGIKIDRSFIHNISNESENAGITAAMIQLAHILNMEVIAEGVETDEELQFLEEHNCHHVQGFLFSKPLPTDEFKQLLMDGI